MKKMIKNNFDIVFSNFDFLLGIHRCGAFVYCDKEIKMKETKTTKELFDIKDIFTCVNAEAANKYIFKDVYLANSLTQLYSDVEKDKFYILDCVLDNDTDRRFYNGTDSYSICLPVEKVKTKEETYRPFKNLEEFTKTLKCTVGDVITYRPKSTHVVHHALLIDMYQINFGFVIIGNATIMLENLFDGYEWLDTDEKWKPCGVKNE